MSLPISDAENELILASRPADDLYPRVKDAVEGVKVKEAELKVKLAQMILEDLTVDFALANSIDSVGEVIEYLTQEYQIERPSFDGKALLRDLSRIGKLSMSLKYAEVLGVEGEALDLLTRAEIERLWGDTALALNRKQIVLNQTNKNAPMPDSNGVRKPHHLHLRDDKNEVE